MNVWCARVSPISPPISDMKNPHLIRSRYPIFRTLTPPMPMSEASHAVSNTLDKSESLMTGASIILYLISLKALDAFSGQWNSSFFRQSVIGAMIVLNLFINYLYKVASPWKLLTLRILWGSGHSTIAWTFWRRRNPLRRHNKFQKYNLISHKSTFFGFTYNFSFLKV